MTTELNHTYLTQRGDIVRIICIDRKGFTPYTVVGLVSVKNVMLRQELIIEYTDAGKAYNAYTNGQKTNDLVSEVKPRGEAMTALELLREALMAHGYTGLVKLSQECGCSLDDLAPCEGGPADCVPGYRHDCWECPGIGTFASRIRCASSSYCVTEEVKDELHGQG